MENCQKWFEKILTGWCILLMGIMALSVIISVFLRYVLGITFVWAEEAITYFFIATTYFGAILGVKENEHIRYCNS